MSNHTRCFLGSFIVVILLIPSVVRAENIVWEQVWPGGTSVDRIQSVVADSSGNTYSVGNGIIYKYDFQKTSQGQRTLAYGGVVRKLILATVAGEQLLYAVGDTTTLCANSARGIWVQKLDLSLTIISRYTYASGCAQTYMAGMGEYARSVDVDASGNVYVAGYYSDIANTRIYWKAWKFNAASISPAPPSKTSTLGGSATGSYAQDIKIDPNSANTIYAVGRTDPVNTKLWFVKYDSDLGVVISPTVSGDYRDGNYDIKIGGAGEVYVMSPKINVPAGVTLAKYDSSGKQDWIKSFTISSDSSHTVTAGRQMVLSGGYLYIGGTDTYQNPVPNIYYKLFFVKFDLTTLLFGSPSFTQPTVPSVTWPEPGGGGVALGESAGYFYQAASKYGGGANGDDFRVLKWGPNTAPTINSGQSVETDQNLSTLFTLTGADINGCANGQTFTYAVATQPLVGGTISPSSGTLTCSGASPATLATTSMLYRPTAGWSGSTSFAANFSDGFDISSPNTTIPVTVNAPLPTASLSASPLSIPVNGSSILTWGSGGGATSCAFQGTPVNGISTGGLLSGNVSTGSLTTSQTYLLTCTGPGGTSSPARADVTVLDPRALIDASPARVRSGGTSAISWSASDVTGCSVSGPGLSPNPTTDYATATTSQSVAITTQSTYTITCSTASGSSLTDSVIVNVVPVYQDF